MTPPPHGTVSVPGSANYGGPPPPGTYPSGYDSRSGSWEQQYVPPPMASPAVVEERNSFDSYESSGNSRGSSHYYPYHQEYSRDPRGYPASYPPTHGTWQQHPPPDSRAGGYSYPGWGGGYEPTAPPPHHPHHGYPPPHHHHHNHPHPHHHMTPPRMMVGPPPTPPYYDERSSYPHHIQPSPYGGPPMPLNRPMYPYMLPPADEKTVLRKKFSWKHFPELERFLIENRDDYLKFSSRNYTVEQKQFNNTLTERLIVLAEKHAYVFDPEEFNFVAIRDRIRCYYKSYVQTARKRGLMLPTDKASSGLSATGVSAHDDAMDDQSHDAGNDLEEGVEVDENGVTSSSSNAIDKAAIPSDQVEESRE